MRASMSHNPSVRSKPWHSIWRVWRSSRGAGAERGIQFIYGVRQPRASAIFAVQQSAGGDRIGEKPGDRLRRHVARDERLADAARQDEGDAAASHLLVLAHGGEQRLGGERHAV